MVDANKCHTCGTVIKPGREIVRAGKDGARLCFCSLQCRGGPKVTEWIIQKP